MSPRLLLLRLLRRWHARIGFAAMLFFLILVVTGLALNHGQSLGLDDIFVVASDAALYVYRENGELIEKLGPGALPGSPVRAIGSSGRAIVLRAASGIFASADALSWRPVPQLSVRWSAPAELSISERRAYGEALAPGVSVEQLLLDLHSGRFAGRHGPLVVDLLALLLAILSVTGAWLFLVPRMRGRH